MNCDICCAHYPLPTQESDLVAAYRENSRIMVIRSSMIISKAIIKSNINSCSIVIEVCHNKGTFSVKIMWLQHVISLYKLMQLHTIPYG